MIQFDSVTKKYRGNAKPALDNVNLQISRGEFVFLVGASGSGKSSCLQLMLREEQPTRGSIHVLGHDLGAISSRKVPYFRRNLGVVFQDFRLLPNKTVHDNVAFTLQVIGKSRGFIQEAVPDTLEMVGLGGKSKRFPHELSGGEQQRVAIARAIVNKPAILLADEPTGNLDPATSLGIMQLLQAINAAGTTVVMATHEAGFVDIMQQRVIELSGGVIMRDEKQGGYGVSAVAPAEVDLTQRDTPLVLRESEAKEAASTAEPAVEPEPAKPSVPAAETEPTPAQPTPASFDEIPDETVISTGRGATAGQAPMTLDQMLAGGAAAAGAAAVTNAPKKSNVISDPPGINLDEPEAGQQAGESEAASKPGQDPLKLSETGTLAQQLGLDTHGEDDESDVGPVR